MPPTVLPAAEGVTTRNPDTSRTKREAPDKGPEPRLHEIARDCTRLHEIARDCTRRLTKGQSRGWGDERKQVIRAARRARDAERAGGLGPLRRRERHLGRFREGSEKAPRRFREGFEKVSRCRCLACTLVQSRAISCNLVHSRAISCNLVQSRALSCNLVRVTDIEMPLFGVCSTLSPCLAATASSLRRKSGKEARLRRGVMGGWDV